MVLCVVVVLGGVEVGVGETVVVIVVREGGMQPLGFLAETVLAGRLAVSKLGCEVGGRIITYLARRRGVAQRRSMVMGCLGIVVSCWVFREGEVGMKDVRLHAHVISLGASRLGPRHTAKYYHY